MQARGSSLSERTGSVYKGRRIADIGPHKNFFYACFWLGRWHQGGRAEDGACAVVRKFEKV